MSKNSGSFSLRMARPDELHRLVAIDDEASELYAQAGIKLDFGKDHPFVVAESVRWAAAIEQGLAQVAVDRKDQPVGFVTLRLVDGEPYLDQISVSPGSMRRGVGARLLEYAISWSGDRSLWLTTYSHLPWNRPYYERHGFVLVPGDACGAELCSILQEQCSALPDPDQRVAMVHRPLSNTV